MADDRERSTLQVRKVAGAVLLAAGSLQVTVVLLALSIFLVFAGTVAQIDHGLGEVTREYFRSGGTKIPLSVFFPRDWNVPSWMVLFFPGGWLLGALLTLNLIAGVTTRFSFKARGKRLTGGLLLALAGVVVTIWAAFREGASGEEDPYWKVMSQLLQGGAAGGLLLAGMLILFGRKGGGLLLHFGIVFMMSAELVVGLSATEGVMHIREGGSNREVELRDRFELVVVDHRPAEFDRRIVIPGSRLYPGARIRHDALSFEIEVEKGSGRDREIRLAWTDPENAFRRTLDLDVRGGHAHTVGKWEMVYRSRRIQKPYRFHLEAFRVDRYPGSDQARDFFSDIRAVDGDGTERRVRISMNRPFRFRGDTYYQHSYDRDERGTILQVVTNAGWRIPYISCMIVMIGMLAHFLAGLAGHLKKRQGRDGEGGPHFAIAGVAGILVALGMIWGVTGDESPAARFGRLPVNHERVRPISSMARDALRNLSERSSVEVPEGASGWKRISPGAWLLDHVAGREGSDDARAFRILHPDLLDLLGLKTRKGHRYAWREFSGHLPSLDRKARDAWGRKEAGDSLDGFDHAVMEMWRKADLYRSLGANIFPEDFLPLLRAHAEGKNGHFEEELDRLESRFAKIAPEGSTPGRISAEAFLVEREPFWFGMWMFFAGLLLFCLSWLGKGRVFRSLSFGAVTAGLVLQTFGLCIRLYVMDMLPFTNLYSTVVFVGWGCVLAGMLMDRLFRLQEGLLVAAFVGFVSLLASHSLAMEGDTMGNPMAVLNSRFWLNAHVMTISIGYVTTFLAGFLGMILLFRRLRPAVFPVDEEKRLSGMIYGMLCFSMLFSFLGTVLGGLWADCSWGRFWGWDPKENGALMLVLWCGVILHARWCGMIRERGLAAMAVFGNVITAWAWFGTNLMGVGLHAYGHTEGRIFWLLLFVASQTGVVFMAALLPERKSAESEVPA